MTTVRNNHTRDKFHSHICSEPYFVVLKQFKYFTLYNYLLTSYLLTYLLHGAVLLEKLTGLQLVKKFPGFHGTPRFITVLTRVRHLSLSWASPIQSIYPHPTSRRTIIKTSRISKMHNKSSGSGMRDLKSTVVLKLQRMGEHINEHE